MDVQATEPHKIGNRGRLLALLLLLIPAAGCNNAAIEANQRQVDQNQALIEQQQRDIARLQSEMSAPPPPPAAPIPGNTGNCDKGVEAAATKRGGDAMASGDMTKAIGYYKDALSACPGSSKADMNLARVYETLDNRDEAIRYYKAAASSKQSDGANAKAANAALARLAEH